MSLDRAFAQRRVLITGGAGFIGSNLAHRLVQAGAHVTIVDSLIPEYGGNLFNLDGISDRVHLNISDIRDPHGIAYLVRGQHVLFNLAGQVSHLDSMTDPVTDLEINCRSQLTILEACRLHNPKIIIVYASTRQLYGRPRYLPVDEAHPTEPTDVNGINMLAGEQYHLLYHRIHGIRAVSLRMTNTFGPRQLMRHNRQGVIPWLIHRAIEGETLEIFGTGRQQRDMNYVDDVVEAMCLAAEKPAAYGQIYNLGHPERLSLEALARLIVEVAGRGNVRLVPFPVERQAIDIGDYYASYEKIRRELGWTPRVSVREGVERTVAFYQRYHRHYWDDNA